MAKEKTTKKQGSRKVSPYNTFIKTEIAKVKKANPTMAHKEVFKTAAGNWAKSEENPKNKEKK